MIAYFLFVFTGLTWLLATVSAPDSAPTAPANPKVSIYEITSPVPYQVVTDQVDIIGSVNSPDMTRYFVEYYRVLDDGAHWLPATPPRIHPVFGDSLGTFNTTVLPDGRYEMRLLVRTVRDEYSYLAFGPVVVRNSRKVVVTETPALLVAGGRTKADENAPTHAGNVTASVDAPLPGQVISGAVDIIGTVDAPALKSFFVEFSPVGGNHLFDWVPATLPRAEAVRSDVLGTWNTQCCRDGSYKLRLIVTAGDDPAQRFLIGTFEVKNNS